MRTLLSSISGTYVFSPSTRTVTIAGLDELTMDNLLYIEDVTANKVLWSFDGTVWAPGGSIDGLVVTLDCSMTGLSSTDTLNIYVDIDESSSILVEGTKSVVLAEALNQSVLKGTNNYLSADVTRYKNKTVQIYSSADGYCGLEVSLNNQWRSLSSSQNIIYQDAFTGNDGDALASAWEVTKTGTYTDATTYALIYGNKMKLNIAGTAGIPKVQALVNKPIYLSREYVIKFTLDETLFTSAVASREFHMGITPTKPTTGGTEVGGLTNSKILLYLYNGDIFRTGSVKILDNDSPSASQEYTIIINATKLKIYRGTTLLCEYADTYDQTQYYVWFQGMVNYAAGPLGFTIDNFLLYNRDVTSKVLANTLYTKTISDAIVGNMRVNFLADFGADATADIRIIGQG